MSDCTDRMKQGWNASNDDNNVIATMNVNKNVWSTNGCGCGCDGTADSKKPSSENENNDNAMDNSFGEPYDNDKSTMKPYNSTSLWRPSPLPQGLLSDFKTPEKRSELTSPPRPEKLKRDTYSFFNNLDNYDDDDQDDLSYDIDWEDEVKQIMDHCMEVMEVTSILHKKIIGKKELMTIKKKL